MSNYRLEIVKRHEAHTGDEIDCLHVMIDSNSNLPIADTHIPLDDIQAAVKRHEQESNPIAVGGENICPQCGGLLKIEYIVEFNQCLPHSLRIEPTLPPIVRLCPGHPTMRDMSDWEQLDNEQKNDVSQLRKYITDDFIAATELFYKKHPELQLTWQFTLNALIRGKHDVLRDDRMGRE
jgi:hypothetical protein